MPTMAEIEEDYPERLAALKAAMGISFAEAMKKLAAGLELYRAALTGKPDDAS